MSREQHTMMDTSLDIRDRVIAIETKREAQLTAIEELKADVKSHGQDILRAKTSVRLMRWVFGILLISLPATVMAVVRIFKG